MPPRALDVLRWAGVYRYGFHGAYGSWPDAAAECGLGYVDPATLEHTIRMSDAARALADARSPAVESSAMGLLTSLLHIVSTLGASVSERGARLEILDFGGSLGKHFFEVRRFLNVAHVRWTVCETKLLVETGDQRFASDELRFASQLSGLKGPFSVAIASGSLQYLEDPARLLADLGRRAGWLILDRLPLRASAATHALSVQHVPPWIIYSARYPAWIFAREAFMAAVTSFADVVLSWTSPETIWYAGETIPFRGMLLRARDATAVP